MEKVKAWDGTSDDFCLLTLTSLSLTKNWMLKGPDISNLFAILAVISLTC